MSKRIFAGAIAAVLALALFPVSAAVYHVDADTGDDASDGQSPDHAWKTLARVLIFSRCFSEQAHNLTMVIRPGVVGAPEPQERWRPAIPTRDVRPQIVHA
jgi:hypothetical protein